MLYFHSVFQLCGLPAEITLVELMHITLHQFAGTMSLADSNLSVVYEAQDDQTVCMLTYEIMAL